MGVKETWAKLLSNRFHEGKETVICTECIMEEMCRGVGPSGHGREGWLGKQMECQPPRKINEAAIGAN